MRKIKIAQIGTSLYSHGNCIFESLKKNSDIFEIAGYVFPENEREKFPENMADFEGYPELSLEEVLENPEIEAVAIETEEIYLAKYARLAAEHHKHIHMEKPGGVHLADFEALIEVVKKEQKVFHMGYMYRYNPYLMELKEQIKKGELGDIISVEAQMNCLLPTKTRQWLETFSGGMMFYLGCHLVDLIVSIQGEPERILPLNTISGIDGVEAEDFGMAVFEYKNGISFAKTSAVEIGGFERRQLVVAGTKKTVELNPLEWYADVEHGDSELITKRTEREGEDWHAVGKKEQSKPFDRYDGMMQSFAQMVRGEKENLWDYDYEFNLYKIILKACGGKL